MFRKISLYLDTSIPNALFLEPDDWRREVTELFYTEIIPASHVFISELLLDEINATPDKRLRKLLMDSVAGFQIIKKSSSTESLAKEYLRRLKIPRNDARHIAIASLEGMNYVVSWNLKHLVRERTKRIVDDVNFILRLPSLYIVTPDDFFE